MSFSKNLKHAALALALAFAVIFQLACSGDPVGKNSGTSEGGAVQLQGQGASFPKPMYEKWISEYGKLHSNVRLDYQSQGSGAGIKAIQNQTADFGASDAPMSDEDLKKAPGEILHIPTVLGAVVLTYNMQGATQPLRFSPDVIVDIFLGKIKKWDDARIKADNPNVTLPANDITVVYRSDGSGTTQVFTDYLSKVSPEWKQKVGTDKAPKWPDGIGVGAKGNEGVTGQVKNTPNTIGYVELAFAKNNALPIAVIKNSAGNFVEPTLEAVTAAASESAASMPETLHQSITNASGANAYPISSYTYILIYKDQKDAAKGKALVDFLWWCLHDGEKYVKELLYAPLPPDIVKRAEAKLNTITSGGKPVRGA